MNYSQKEIIDALTLIKDICCKSTTCSNCPFRGDNPPKKVCMIVDTDPDEWRIAAYKNWRAFE